MNSQDVVGSKASQGHIVAIVGADGSGKTTAINGLLGRLKADHKVAAIHMGTPHWCIVTLIVRGLLKAVRFLFRRQFIRKDAENSLFGDRPVFPGYSWLTYQACMAFDRYHAYLRAKWQAGRGKLVLCDRFPLRQIKLADSPQIKRMTAGCRRNIAIGLLAKLEEWCYRGIRPPDLVLVLDVDPDVAVARKQKIHSAESPAQIRSCAREIQEIDWSGIRMHIIDANRPVDAVVSHMEQLLCSDFQRPKAGLRPELSS